MKRRILLVDDEVAVLLTLKAVLEINGFDVDTAASGREGRMKLRSNEYHMVISDMRMENDEAGAEVIAAARSAPYQPAVALLTAYPLAEEDWQEMGADRMLVKPMHTRLLLEQIDRLLASHSRRPEAISPAVVDSPKRKASKKGTSRKSASPSSAKGASKKASAKKTMPKKTVKKIPAKQGSAAKKSKKR